MRWAALGVALLVAGPAGGGEGAFVVSGGPVPAARVVNGHVQAVTPLGEGRVRVQVSVHLDPVGARGPAAREAGAFAEVPEGFELPRELSWRLERSAGAWNRATAVLAWVMEHIRVDVDDGAPQDAGTVLRTGSGRCSGLANAGVALLRAAGFAARTVSGVLVGREGPVAHRWLECLLPGAGWVPSDPTLGLWVITPRHVAFAGPVVELPRIRVLRVHEEPLAGLPRVRGFPARINDGGELVCTVVEGWDGVPLVARLEGPGGERRRLRLSPGGTFAGLAPGEWRLTVFRSGRIVDRKSFTLEPGGSLSYAVRLPGPPEVG